VQHLSDNHVHRRLGLHRHHCSPNQPLDAPYIGANLHGQQHEQHPDDLFANFLLLGVQLAHVRLRHRTGRQMRVIHLIYLEIIVQLKLYARHWHRWLYARADSLPHKRLVELKSPTRSFTPHRSGSIFCTLCIAWAWHIDEA
jgi:hypothetical protein